MGCLAELIVMAEEAVADMPLETLEWYHEKFILNYFAEVGCSYITVFMNGQKRH